MTTTWADAGSDAPRYVVIGCLTVDSVVTASGDLIPRACGGNSLYATAGVHVWDDSVGLVTRAGFDYPAECLAEIEGRVVRGGVRRLESPHPVHVAFAYQVDGSRTRRIPPQTLASIPADLRPYFDDDTHDDGVYRAATPDPDDIPPAWVAGARGVHLPPLLPDSHAALISSLRASQPGITITLDPPWADRGRPAPDELSAIVRAVDVVLPSEADLVAFSPDRPLIDAARELLDLGAHSVVVKLGAAGSIVATEDDAGATFVPAYPAATVDPTGAGDSFCGGFLVGFCETGDFVRAAVHGTVAASFVVEERAAIPILGVARRSAEARARVVEDRVRHGIHTDPREGRA